MAVEKTYKRFVSFISNTINTFLSVLKILIQSKLRLKLPSADSSKCFVLANGPSLQQSLEKHKSLFLQNPLICVNTFSLTDEFIKLKPTYYVMIDPFFWNGKSEAVKNTFDSLANNTKWPLYLMVPRRAINQSVFIELQKKNSNIKVTPFNYTVFKGFQSIAQWFYKKNLAMPQSPNVTITALFLGINMGYKEIILTGADHTWHENLYMSDENILHTKVTHFYENDTEVKYIPLYEGGDSNNETRKSYAFFDIWSRTFFAYFQVNDYAKKNNCNIYNASEISFIDAFKRIKL